jgi:hypothetical protein
MFCAKFMFERSIKDIYNVYLIRQLPSSNEIDYLIETNKITDLNNDYDKYFNHMIKKHNINILNNPNINQTIITSFYEHVYKSNDLPSYVKIWGDTGKTIKKINYIKNKELEIMTTNQTLNNVFNIFEYIKCTQTENNKTECIIYFDCEIKMMFTGLIETHIKNEYAKTNDKFQKSILRFLN